MKLHDPIKRNKLTLFSTSGKKAQLQSHGKVRVIEANRDVLGKLLATSTKHGRIVDLKKALEYPLTPVPPSLGNADGTRRTTQKSALMDILLENNSRDTMDPESILPAEEHTLAYVVDLMALIRTFTSYPDTYEGLARKIFSNIPIGYKRIDIIADSYLPQSIKTAKRTKRGMAPKIIISSVQSKLPRDFNKFLSNSENKTRLIELVRSVLIEHKESL